MNRLHLIISTLVLALVFTACEKEIPFKGEIAKRKLVLNADFSPDSTWKVNLSHSLSIGETGQTGPITNAVVRIKNAQDQTVATLDHTGEGIYTSSTLRPNHSENYSVEAEALGYTMVSATDLAPAPFSTSLEDTSSNFFLGEEVIEVDLRIDDPAGQENYYVIECQSILYDSMGYFDEFPSYGISLDPKNDNGDLGDQNTSYVRIYFTDQSFNGQSYSTTVSFFSGILNWLYDADPLNGEVALERIDFNVRVRSVSKSLYQYLKSLDKYENYSYDPTFSQPVQVFSNVKDGFGVFGGYQESILTITYE